MVKRKTACRICSDKFEGLPLVLCHCKPSLHKITSRHDTIVDRLEKASSSNGKLYKKNQPLMGPDLRPDLVLVRVADSAAIVIDVAVTFENGPDAFKKIRDQS